MQHAKSNSSHYNWYKAHNNSVFPTNNMHFTSNQRCSDQVTNLKHSNLQMRMYIQTYANMTPTSISSRCFPSLNSSKGKNVATLRYNSCVAPIAINRAINSLFLLFSNDYSSLTSFSVENTVLEFYSYSSLFIYSSSFYNFSAEI